ncbi:MAG: ABC transporter ATP-binding protein [Gammaproteobacteria bacterium]
MNGQPLLKVRDLIVEYPTRERVRRAVDKISFDVYPGLALGVVGESGCGKSQTMLALLGLLDRNARVQGTVRYKDQQLIGLPARPLNRIRGARIALIFQDPMSALNPHLRIGMQLDEMLSTHTQLKASARRVRIIEMLRSMRLSDPAQCVKRFPHELSGGQRQRVMIAMSLLCEPDILIADEPTTALDATVQADILALLGEIMHKSNMSLVLITHDLGVVAGICERVMVMYAGRVVESAPAEAIFYNPQHPYTQGLLACSARMTWRRDDVLPTIPGQPPNSGSPAAAGCRFAPRCRHRFERCDRETPELVVRRDGHAKACHLEQVP